MKADVCSQMTKRKIVPDCYRVGVKEGVITISCSSGVGSDLQMYRQYCLALYKRDKICTSVYAKYNSEDGLVSVNGDDCKSDFWQYNEVLDELRFALKEALQKGEIRPLVRADLEKIVVAGYERWRHI